MFRCNHCFFFCILRATSFNCSILRFMSFRAIPLRGVRPSNKCRYFFNAVHQMFICIMDQSQAHFSFCILFWHISCQLHHFSKHCKHSTAQHEKSSLYFVASSYFFLDLVLLKFAHIVFFLSSFSSMFKQNVLHLEEVRKKGPPHDWQNL